MIDEHGMILVAEIHDCNYSIYWHLIDNYNYYMNKLNKTKNEEYSFAGDVMIDYVDVR